MRIVLQRVLSARARCDGREVAAIELGLVAFVGSERGDTVEAARRLAAKLSRVRIFEQGDSLFGRSVVDVGGSVLTVSQMPLAADFSRGSKPNFSRAADQETARELYEDFGSSLETAGVAVAACPFGSRLELEMLHWGPFTSVLESKD